MQGTTRAGGRTAIALALAVAAVWVLWGSTFAAMRAADESIPPFAMAAVRFLTAGGILWAILFALGRGMPTRNDWRDATVTGATLLLLGTGMTAFTLQYLPTGLNSLLLSLSPVWMAAFEFAFARIRPSRFGVAGMVLGFVGLAVLLQPKASGPIPVWPALLAIGASISWAFGSIYQRRVASGDMVRLAAMQMVIGGALLSVETLLTGELHGWSIAHLTAASLGGLAWLIVFGSLLGYCAFLYTMRNAPIGLASTYAYVNPIVAIALGTALFGERLSPLAMLAAAVILAGVALMLVPVRRAAPVRRPATVTV